MAFNRNELSLMATTAAAETGQHLWFYANTAADNLDSTAVVSGFFDGVSDSMNTGDVMFVANGGLIRFIDVTAGAVTFTDPDVATAA